MALSFTLLFAAKQINNAAPDTLFTVPDSPSNNVLRNGRIRFANTSGAAVTVQAWGVPKAGTAGNGNVFQPTYSIPANGFIDVDVPMLGAGAFVQAQAGAATAITASLLDGFVQS